MEQLFEYCAKGNIYLIQIKQRGDILLFCSAGDWIGLTKCSDEEEEKEDDVEKATEIHILMNGFRFKLGYAQGSLVDNTVIVDKWTSGCPVLQQAEWQVWQSEWMTTVSSLF